MTRLERVGRWGVVVYSVAMVAGFVAWQSGGVAWLRGVAGESNELPTLSIDGGQRAPADANAPAWPPPPPDKDAPEMWSGSKVGVFRLRPLPKFATDAPKEEPTLMHGSKAPFFSRFTEKQPDQISGSPSTYKLKIALTDDSSPPNPK